MGGRGGEEAKEHEEEKSCVEKYLNILNVSRSLGDIQSSKGSGERIMLINDRKLLSAPFRVG